MLTLPNMLSAEEFLQHHWQKRALLMPSALPHIRPAISRNELGWLATLPDVESRLVFINRDGEDAHYYTETGPFDETYLQNLPKRDWTLLVHDVEKHLPEMRALFQHVPFIPDWRIDDLMVSFAAPGGGVGPHKDNYDVFLCQGIGVRNWRFTSERIEQNKRASDDLALLNEFDGESYDLIQGDVLYLPPGVPHWGTARRACMTYSIGMRAPQASDFSNALNLSTPAADNFYSDPDLQSDEATPGFISATAVERSIRLLGDEKIQSGRVAKTLGCLATQPKEWLTPEHVTAKETRAALQHLQIGGEIEVHGMAKIAFDAQKLYVNGRSMDLPPAAQSLVKDICKTRRVSGLSDVVSDKLVVLRWMLKHGAFEIPETL